MRYRVLDIKWSGGIQSEMLKFPFVQWYWLMHYKSRSLPGPMRSDLTQRFEYVLYYESGKYDLAILHLTQDCLDPIAWECGRGALYREMDEVIQDIPKIVMLHGVPPRAERVGAVHSPDEITRRIKEIAGHNRIVVGSEQAAREWGCGQPICDGLEPNDWLDLPKQARVVTGRLPVRGCSDRDRKFVESVRHELKALDIIDCHLGNSYIATNWDDYRNLLGRALIYLDPIRDSSAARARAEAMLSGCCVLTFPTHDAAAFIENGVNGFMIETNAKMIARLVDELICAPKRTIGIGQQGKLTAQLRFDWDRFARNWKDMLHSVVCETSSPVA